MKSKPYDIVLLPESDLTERAIELSEHLKSMGVHFTLSSNRYFPHLSLYMLQLDKEGLKKALNLLLKIADDTNVIKATVIHYNYENNYVDAEYAKSKELSSLQEAVIAKLNPVRDGMRKKDAARLAKATGETRSNLLNYGYRSVGNLFKPHLTFTRFKGDQKQLIQTFPAKETFDGRFTSLGIFEMGENGTCVHKVKTWNLK